MRGQGAPQEDQATRLSRRRGGCLRDRLGGPTSHGGDCAHSTVVPGGPAGGQRGPRAARVRTGTSAAGSQAAHAVPREHGSDWGAVHAGAEQVRLVRRDDARGLGRAAGAVGVLPAVRERGDG